MFDWTQMTALPPSTLLLIGIGGGMLLLIWFATSRSGSGSLNIKWIVTNYWHSKGLRHWIFSSGKMELLCLGDVPIVRHTKIRMDMNPYLDTEYFIRRKFRQGMKRLSGRFKKIWRNQNGCCYHCGLPMEIRDDREIFYKVPLSMGGKDEVPNMAYVHKYCQSIFLERRAKA